MDLQGGSHSVSQVDGSLRYSSSLLTLWGLAKRPWPLFTPSQTLRSLPVYHWCPSSCYCSAGAQREWVWVGDSMCGFFTRNCLGLQQFLPPTQSLLFSAARTCGDLFPGTGILGWWAWCGSGTPHSGDIPLKFLSTWVWGQPVLRLHPSYQSGWMWFLNSEVVWDHCCQTSVQLDFWCSWVMVVLCFSHNFDVVVWGCEPWIPIPPSWPEVTNLFFTYAPHPLTWPKDSPGCPILKPRVPIYLYQSITSLVDSTLCFVIHGFLHPRAIETMHTCS